MAKDFLENIGRSAINFSMKLPNLNSSDVVVYFERTNTDENKSDKDFGRIIQATPNMPKTQLAR